MSARGRHIRSVFTRRWLIAARETRLGLVAPPRRRAVFARELRRAFEELGPAFVKLGQLISVRPDEFPPEYVFEMEDLLDSVPPAPFPLVRKTVEDELGHPLEELFSEFDPNPVGSASVAQVHRAVLREEYRPVIGETLPAGTPLAIKVVRPGSDRAIVEDLALAAPLVRKLSRIPALRRFNLPDIFGELADSLRSECDLRIEGRLSDRFAFDFRDDPLVLTPTMVWPLTTRSVLTMKFIEGWRLSDARDAEAAGVDARMLATHGAEAFMTQVLVLGRYHADLHQSNLLITPDSRICYLDFGIVGELGTGQRDAVAQVLAATVYGDADRALKYSADLGLIIPEDRRDKVRSLVAELMGRTLAGDRHDIKGFAMGFLGIMNDERVSVPKGFGLLVKALVTVEGCSKMIYPDIDIIEAARPFATQLIARNMMRPARLYARLPGAIEAAMTELVG